MRCSDDSFHSSIDRIIDFRHQLMGTRLACALAADLNIIGRSAKGRSERKRLLRRDGTAVPIDHKVLWPHLYRHELITQVRLLWDQ